MKTAFHGFRHALFKRTFAFDGWKGKKRNTAPSESKKKIMRLSDL